MGHEQPKGTCRVSQKVETVIIGGGQAGLANSYYLKQKNHEHVVLEAAARAAHAWRDDRWDSFTLVTPNWSFRIPGIEYEGPNPHGFMDREEIIECFERYIHAYNLPVLYDTRVTSVEPVDNGYRIRAEGGDWITRQVVVATGLYQKPRIPRYAAELSPDILQLHSGNYRNPGQLPEGAVLITGSAQSGCQIAEELYQAGRIVYLSVCSAGRAPRRYRGRDIFEWLHLTGFVNRTPEMLPSRQARFAGNPHVSGKNGGHSINLHQFYKDGVTLVGRTIGVREGALQFAPDLKENLAKGDSFEATVTKMIDDYIDREHVDAPAEPLPRRQDGFSAPEIISLPLKETGISTIIWAFGYTFDFTWVNGPVFDEAGFPVTDRGVVTAHPGLFFSGMPWLPSQKSGVLLGVGEQASHIASQVAGQVAGR
jgi:putative flavoprotein involved in K+ transport